MEYEELQKKYNKNQLFENITDSNQNIDKHTTIRNLK